MLSRPGRRISRDFPEDDACNAIRLLNLESPDSRVDGQRSEEEQRGPNLEIEKITVSRDISDNPVLHPYVDVFNRVFEGALVFLKPESPRTISGPRFSVYLSTHRAHPAARTNVKQTIRHGTQAGELYNT